MIFHELFWECRSGGSCMLCLLYLFSESGSCKVLNLQSSSQLFSKLCGSRVLAYWNIFDSFVDSLVDSLDARLLEVTKALHHAHILSSWSLTPHSLVWAQSVPWTQFPWSMCLEESEITWSLASVDCIRTPDSDACHFSRWSTLRGYYKYLPPVCVNLFFFNGQAQLGSGFASESGLLNQRQKVNRFRRRMHPGRHCIYIYTPHIHMYLPYVYTSAHPSIHTCIQPVIDRLQQRCKHTKV